MQKRILPLLVAALLVGGCNTGTNSTSSVTPTIVQGSGTTVTKPQTVSSFNQVEINNAFNATVELGPAESVTVTADDNVMPYVSVTQKGKTVVIGLAPNSSVANATLQVAITAPDLRSVSASGASSVTVNGANPKASLELTVNGASRADGLIESANLVVNADGSSSVKLTGNAPQIEVNANGASNADLSGLVAANAGVNADGASTISVLVNGVLNVSAKGASTVNYTGDTKLGMQTVSEGSTLQKK